MSAARLALAGGAGVSLVAVLALAEPTIKKWEGYSNDPYRDIAGIRTVCWGETAGVQARRYSDAECQAMFRQSVIRHGAPIVACLPAAAPASVQASFVSFGYNVGVQAACGSTAAQRARRGDYAGACEALTWWNKARNPVTGKLEVSRGLANRRADERALCLKGLA